MKEVGKDMESICKQPARQRSEVRGQGCAWQPLRSVFSWGPPGQVPESGRGTRLLREERRRRQHGLR